MTGCAPPTGLVADVVPHSVVDGPGSRFVVFLQGCNLNCAACHNPHTIPRTTPRALRSTTAELTERLRPVAPFVRGVTVSGGEATLQDGFVREWFRSLHADPALRRLTRFVDSNGMATPEVWERLLPEVDGVMVDLKAFDPVVHRRLTGADNAPVLASLRLLAAADRLYEVRLLVVPGHNDSAAALERTAHWLLQLDPQVRVRVIGFRGHGVRAAARTWAEPDEAARAAYAEVLRSSGISRLTVV